VYAPRSCELKGGAMADKARKNAGELRGVDQEPNPCYVCTLLGQCGVIRNGRPAVIPCNKFDPVDDQQRLKAFLYRRPEAMRPVPSS
jgi:hypothetical protein